MVSPVLNERRHSRGFIVSEQPYGTYSRQQVTLLQQVVTPPAAAPTLTPSAAGGALATGTIFGKVTYVTASGETIPSAEQNIAVTGPTGSVTVTSPPAQSGATGWNFYAAGASGAETRQNATPVAIGTSFVLTALGQGAFSPTLEPSAILPAGLILGLVSTGLTAAGSANAGNTGNGTIGAVAISQGVTEGTYAVEFIAPTVYNVTSPSGALVGEGHTGVAFSAGGLGFTITAGGTAFAAGDGFGIMLAANPNAGLYAPLNLLAVDGTQNPAAVLMNEVDASQGNILTTVLARAA